MTEPEFTSPEQIIAALRRHPRVVYQHLIEGDDALAHLIEGLPQLVPFPGNTYHSVLAVLDWDHRLPSRAVVLRLYLYYADSARSAGEAEFEGRSAQIEARDKYPEFDVPDYAGLLSDEAYEAEVDASGKIDQVRLVSAWRRDVEHADARLAVQIVRRSEDFKQLDMAARRRPSFLGDLEAVSWTPPCESNFPSWTIDVWYLTDVEGTVGRGRSFLVDLQGKRIIGVREFVVRSQ